MKKKILISAANGPIMRSLILLLKKKGFYIIGIDASIIGNADTFCDEFYKSPKGTSKTFPKFLNKLSSKVEAIYLSSTLEDSASVEYDRKRSSLNYVYSF